jgi:tetratricopeptide (TPR) repeat protein
MDPTLRRRLRLLLTALAVVYALLACLRTVGDFDTGWHLATGRYLLQHHAIPATDVLSYTSPGAPWLYPPFAGALLYAVFQAFGYAGLSWFSVLAAAVLAGYLLWRALPQAGLAAPVLLALAVPSLAYRLTPRADLFTTLFFALFLTELWRFHRAERARLWLLPVVMLLWVNLHPGFIAGLGLVAAYVLCEALRLPFRELRAGARQRLAISWPWLAATAAAVLVNPWGVAALRQARALAGLGGNSQAAPRFVGELSRQTLSWHVIPQAFHLRDPDSAFWWLLLAAAAAVLQALRRREIGAALVLAVSMAAALQKLRFQGLFSVVVIVIGGTLLAEAFAEFASRKPRPAPACAPAAGSVALSASAPVPGSAALSTYPATKLSVAVQWCTVSLLAILCAITTLRIADLASNRYYVVSASTSVFGPGESWWFPERAAAFMEREKLPGNIFQPYNLGGFTALRLGPHYLDYSDGRGISGEVATEEQALLAQSPDSALWEQVASRRNINVILLSLARYGGLGGFDLNAFCGAAQWRPVYLDEVSIMLLRYTEQNKPWLDRLELNCQNAVFTPPPQASHGNLFEFYANSGAVLYALERDTEAEAAWQRSLALEPEDPNVHLFLAQLYQQQRRPGDAEREYRAALSRRQSAVAWYALGRLLAMQHRYSEAEPAIAIAATMTATPANQYKALGQVQLHLNQPARALASFLKAEQAGPRTDDPSPAALDFRLQLDDGRAGAWLALHDAQRATGYAEEATRLAPQPQRWNLLADCYVAQGRPAEAEQARSRARELPAPAPH